MERHVGGLRGDMRYSPVAERPFLQQNIEHIPTGICVFQQQGGEIRCLSVNSRYAAMMGMEVNLLEGSSIEVFFRQIHPDDIALCRKETLAVLNGCGSCSGTYRVYNQKEKKYTWIRFDGQLVIHPDGTRCASFTYADVDALVRAGEAVDSIVRHVPGGVFVYSADEEERFSFVSLNMLAMLGYTREEFDRKFGGRFSRLVYEGDRERVLSEINRQIDVGFFDTCTYRIEKKDGTLLWVRDEGHIAVDAQGQRWFYVVIIDITSSVQAKDALVLQNNELRRLIDSIPVRIIVYKKQDGRVRIAAVNGYLGARVSIHPERLLSMSADELLKLVHPEDRSSVRHFFQELFLKDCGITGLTYRTTMDSDASFQWYHCDAIRVAQDDGTDLVYAVYTDASYQKVREADFSRIIQDLLTTNPHSLCTFRLNLSRNLCSDCHGATAYTRQLLNARTADALLESIASIFTDGKEAGEFREQYSRIRLMERFRNGEDHFSITYRRLTDNSEPHWVTTYFHILENPYTREIEAIAYSVDSDRTRKEEEILDAITGEEYDSIGLIDVASGQLSYYYLSGNSARQEDRRQESYRETMLKVCDRMFTDEERGQYLHAVDIETIRSALRTGPVYSYAYFSRNEQGERRRKQVSFRYLEADHREIMFSRSDITAMFEHEERYMEKLRNALLNAEKANEMKSDFIGNVSHDIRTPLNAILGYNKLAMEADSAESRNDYLKKIEIAGNILLSLINDTLDLQKIENGAITLNPETLSCREVMEEIIDSVQPLMAQKHINFVVDTSRAVLTDIRVDIIRIRQVFINLLSNAVKFTPEGGRIDLIVECVALEDDSVSDRIIIRDTGIGMSQGFQERMFEPFSQERNHDTAHIGGSGLGLSIVRRLVALMGGKIEVRSELGKGTEFTLYLDFQRDEEHHEFVDHDESIDISGLRILLCEDNQMNTEIARRILEKKGAEVVTAADGQEGLDIFVDSDPQTFDIILMDIRMPNLDGYTATRKIRESRHPQAQTIPVLAMSADAYESDVAKAMKSGMNGHVSKPIDPKRIVSEISRLVQESRGQEKTGKTA